MEWANFLTKYPPTAARGKAVYRPELDVIRFFAFLAVFIHHVLPGNTDFYLRHGLGESGAAWIKTFEQAGAHGVDLFFVLSSYLITDLLLRERAARGAIDVKAFYVRRALRIWPLYYFYLLLGAVIGWIDPSQKVPPQDLVMFAFFLGNYSSDFESVIRPLWSVSIEEQFYLTWPLAIRNASRRGIMFLALAIASVSIGYRLFKSWHSYDAEIWYNTIARMDTIAVGAILALCLNSRSLKIHSLARWAITFLSIAAVCLLTRFQSLTSSETGTTAIVLGYTVVALAASTLILAWLREASQETLNTVPRVLAWLGRRSYGLYVFHQLSLYFMKKTLDGNLRTAPRFALFVFGGLLLTIIFALISYRFLETPFLNLKKKFNRVAPDILQPVAQAHFTLE